MAGGAHVELLERLTALAREVVAAEGLELVELTLRGSSRKRLLRVDIDRAGPVGVELDDCQRVSQRLGELLEQEDPIEGSYVLEVSSPGVDRPIRTADDVRRNAGRQVVVRTREPIDGRQRFVGLLLEPTPAGGLRLREADGRELEIAPEQVLEARQDVCF